MATQNLLVELLVEELPPKALKKLGEAFSSSLFESLETQGLTTESSTVTSFATPRRLAAHITNVLTVAPDQEINQKLMPVSVAINAENKPTDALRKRLAKEGRESLADLWPNAEDGPDRLYAASDGKSESIFLRCMAKGSSLQVTLQGALEDTINNLPIPKVMTYQLADGWESVNFVRPAHGLVALHGSEIVPITALGLTAGNQTQGHRFEAKHAVITIKNADSYAEQLKTEGAVIASFAERRTEIESQLNAAAAKENLKPIEDDALLDEVTALVERPNVLLGQFEEVYLEVPQECLILTMKANQKYFPLLDANNKLTNKFLIVSNINPADPSAVIGGNERVVRPRLADAKFFFDQDRKKPLESRVLGLAKVVYHNKLGTQGDRVERVQAIARIIGQQLGGETLALQADQAALLAKADLLTDMVGEFPELQGIMGCYYAQHDGLSDDIAFAIEDHYKPRFWRDDLPRNQVGTCVSLADKLETLIGMFGIGNIPTGDKDPFALRRHGLGVVRILAERKLKLDLLEVLKSGATEFSKYNEFSSTTINDLHHFVLERVRGYLREPFMPNPNAPAEIIRGGVLREVGSEMGFSVDEIESVISQMPTRIDLIKPRMDAVRAFASLPEAPALAAANKRVGNILKKAEGEVKAEVKTDLLQEPAEIALNAALSKVKPEADNLFENGDYTASLKALAALKAPVDDFFDNVMVNSENIDLRNNRLALLAQLHAAMNRVADLSKLAG